MGPTIAYTLADVQSLYGKLMHSANIIPAGRAYLTSLETFISTFHDSPHMPRRPPKSLPADLAWWRERLSRNDVSRPIPGSVILTNVHAYSDASSGVGLGITIGNSWRAWRLLPGWQSEGRTIAWAEAVAFELLARCLLKDATPGTHFRIYGDNSGVVDAWKHFRSHDVQVNKVFRRLHELCEDSTCFIHTAYVVSANNPADGPSRGLYPSGPLLSICIIPSDIIPLVELVSDDEITQSHDTRRSFPHVLPKPM